MLQHSNLRTYIFVADNKGNRKNLSSFRLYLTPASLIANSFVFRIIDLITFHSLFSGIRKRTLFSCGNFEVRSGMLFPNDCFESTISLLPLLHDNYLFFVLLMQKNARDNLVTSKKKVRELEAQLQDKQLVSANNRKVPSSVHGRLQLLHLIIFYSLHFSC